MDSNLQALSGRRFSRAVAHLSRNSRFGKDLTHLPCLASYNGFGESLQARMPVILGETS